MVAQGQLVHQEQQVPPEELAVPVPQDQQVRRVLKVEQEVQDNQDLLDLRDLKEELDLQDEQEQLVLLEARARQVLLAGLVQLDNKGFRD
jgi:hypothetical protein